VIGPDGVELRVLGCLIEKQRTTPDAYPLSLNGLRLAANQATGRDPVTGYDEGELRDAIARLVRRGWARLASGPGSRAAKYRHLLDEALALDGAGISLLALLMLRGAQTPGELRARSERLHDFDSVDGLEQVLEALAGRGLAVRFERRPGQKESRWGLDGPFAGGGGGDDEVVAAPAVTPASVATPSAQPTRVEDPEIPQRIAAIERDLAELRDVVARLRELVE
jgi:uncharacterized protein